MAAIDGALVHVALIVVAAAAFVSAFEFDAVVVAANAVAVVAYAKFVGNVLAVALNIAPSDYQFLEFRDQVNEVFQI